MVDLDRLEALGEAAVAACDGLGSHLLVANEAELKDLFDTVTSWPLLINVLPRTSGDDHGHDNYGESNTAVFYVVKPFTQQMTIEQRRAVWKETAQAMKELKEFIRQQMESGEFFDLLNNAEFERRDTVPEYNILGCIGWSMGFEYATDGF